MKREENLNIQITKYQSFETGTLDGELQIKSLGELFLNINKDKKILDVGCGDGVALNWFKDNGYVFVQGIEGNPNKLERAKKSGFVTYEGDIHDLSKIIDDKFDVIYCSHVLEHMFNPDVVIEEFKKLLNFDGIIIIIVPYPDHGPDDAHCGKYYLKTNIKSNDDVDLILVFKLHGLSILTKKIRYNRGDEIVLKLKL